MQAVTLDEFVSGYGRKIDFLKIDAEGAETDIIAGGRSIFADPSYRVTVMMEFAPRFMRKAGIDPAAQLDALRSWGFMFSRIDDRRRKLVPTDAADLLAQEFSDIVMVRE